MNNSDFFSIVRTAGSYENFARDFLASVEREHEALKAFHAIPADQLETVFPDSVAKAKRAASAAIGRTFKVKTGPKSAVTGEAVAVEFKRLRRTERAIIAVWTVTLECGSAKVRRDFDLTSL